MSTQKTSDHFLLVRPDLDDPDTIKDGLLTLHTLATTREGEDVHDFLVTVYEVGALESSGAHETRLRILGSLPTGEKVLCTLTYDDSDPTQMLNIVSIENPLL